MCPSLGSVTPHPIRPTCIRSPSLCHLATPSFSSFSLDTPRFSPYTSLTPEDNNDMQLQMSWENENYLPRGRKVHLTSPLFQALWDSDIITSQRLWADGSLSSPRSSVSRTLLRCSPWHFVQDVSSTQSWELATTEEACRVFVTLKLQPSHTFALWVQATIPLPRTSKQN